MVVDVDQIQPEIVDPLHTEQNQREIHINVRVYKTLGPRTSNGPLKCEIICGLATTSGYGSRDRNKVYG